MSTPPPARSARCWASQRQETGIKRPRDVIRIDSPTPVKSRGGCLYKWSESLRTPFVAGIGADCAPSRKVLNQRRTNYETSYRTYKVWINMFTASGRSPFQFKLNGSSDWTIWYRNITSAAKGKGVWPFVDPEGELTLKMRRLVPEEVMFRCMAGEITIEEVVDITLADTTLVSPPASTSAQRLIRKRGWQMLDSQKLSTRYGRRMKNSAFRS